MWTAWILPPTDNAQTYLTAYFDKTHEYYTQEDLLFKRGLLTINQDWCGAQNGALGDAFNYVYGENWDFLGCGEPADAYLLDFVSLWESNNYQIQNIWAHSGHHGHYFDWDDSQPEGNYLPASTLGTLENGPQFSIVFACGGMQLGHPPEESLSTWYVMGDNNGMSAIGTTRSIGLPAQEYLVRSIRDSSSLAEGLLNYIDFHTSESYIRSIYPDEVNTFVWDILFVGNPYLFRHPDYDNFNFCPLIVK